jgi:hypothetical protein
LNLNFLFRFSTFFFKKIIGNLKIKFEIYKMIKIVDGQYDLNYFDNMSISQLKTYFKQFSSYEDFLKTDKIYFVPPVKFNNWLYTVRFMDFDISKIPKMPSSKFFNSAGITIDKIKYDNETIKVLVQNYQSYQNAEYLRILKEFREIVSNYNDSII